MEITKNKNTMKSTTYIIENSPVVCPRSNFNSCQISKDDSLLPVKKSTVFPLGRSGEARS